MKLMEYMKQEQRQGGQQGRASLLLRSTVVAGWIGVAGVLGMVALPTTGAAFWGPFLPPPPYAYYGPWGAPPWAYAPPPWAYYGRGMPSVRTGNRFPAEYVQQLKGQLGVRPHQEPAWNALVTAVQNLPAHEGLLESKSVLAAYNNLMQVLDPRQQAMAESFRKSLVW
jgi:hypothetical protein